ncbi:EamA family transporter [Psychrobacter immobilis]|uniref:EamA family transporter n=1 Tax=Psychrobacter immobilis TaxID=498 RepID=UPI003FD25472
MKLPPLALATWQTGIAVITLSVLIDFEGITNVATNTQAVWGTVLGLGVLGTGAAYLIYYFIIESLGSVRAAGATYIAPIVAVIIGVIVGENITILEIIALILILGGVLLVQTGRRASV